MAVNGLSLAGLVSAKTVLIEPPSVAIGGVGATAYTAQLRTWIEISTSNLPVINQFAQIKLPIMVDLVNGRGTLTEMCTPALRKPDGTERASIAVNASIVKVCVGRPGANPANENEIFSTSASCDQNLADEDLLRLGLGPVNLVSLRTHLKMDALPLQASVTLAAGETGTVGNDLLLGSTVKNITDALLRTLLVETLDRGPALTLAQRQASAQNLWNAQGAACGQPGLPRDPPDQRQGRHREHHQRPRWIPGRTEQRRAGPAEPHPDTQPARPADRGGQPGRRAADQRGRHPGGRARRRDRRLQRAHRLQRRGLRQRDRQQPERQLVRRRR
ncbi:hypothetical protein ACFJI0_12600 [Hydrogenophaga sp. UC242_53]|uniref:hypothetical protein n=1 Tax=Hydrogenophaga sp. UC242_53 TaxID=3350170 RepID=UPI0036D29AA8